VILTKARVNLAVTSILAPSVAHRLVDLRAVAPFVRQGPHSIMDRGIIAASIVSGLSSGFSAYSHEIECVFAFVVVPENDSRAGSIHAVRPTPPRGS